MHLRENRKFILSLTRASVLKTAIFAVVFFAIAGAVFSLHGASPALAQGTNFGLSSLSGGFTTLSITQIIGNLIKAFMGILGIIALGLVLYAGWLWMSASGNDEQVLRAKKMLTNAAIGLLIILSAYTIVSYIFSALESALGGGTAGGVSIQGQEPGGLGGALGNGIIQSHYPPRNATDVARNTSIIVTFKELMDDTTIMTAAVDTNGDPVPNVYRVNAGTNNIQIVTRADFDANTLHPLTAVTVGTTDHKTYVFTPDDFLGSAERPTGYVVMLGSDIKKLDQRPAFTGAFKNYIWSFEVSTKIDIDPPTVTSVIPLYSNAPTDDSEANTNIHNRTVARNAIVQINFSEAVNPLMVSGIVNLTNDSPKIAVYNSSGTAPVQLTGNFEISNQYKTVEFTTDQECGVNSCGEKVYCLPPDAQIQVLIKSAILTNDLTKRKEIPFLAAQPMTGVADVASNAMDGNMDGKPQNSNGTSNIYNLNVGGPAPAGSDPLPGDNYQWGFFTNNTVDLVPPKVLNYSPVAQSVGVDPNQQLTGTFDKYLSSSSVKPDAGYGDGYCGCSTADDCVQNPGAEQICNSAGRCVLSAMNASGGHDPYVCHKHSDGAECKSTVANTDQDLTLCIEHEHVLLEQPLDSSAVGYYMTTQNNPNPVIKQSTTIMDHVAFGIDRQYGAYYGSGIRDLFQNCYIPNAAPGCPRVGGDTCTPGAAGTAECVTKVGATSFCQTNGTCSYIAGQNWLGVEHYPSCDLTQTTLSTYGSFNLGFSTVSNVNKSIQFPAFSWNKPVADIVSGLETSDYFKTIPQSDTVNLLFYFQQGATPSEGELYLIAYAGKTSATAGTTARAITLNLSPLSGTAVYDPAALTWTDQTKASKTYDLGSVVTGGPMPNVNIQISRSSGSVGQIQFAYPGGIQIFNQTLPVTLSAVDKQPPLVRTGDFEVKYTHDTVANQYVMNVLWDACPALRDTAVPSLKNCATDVAEAYVDWTFPSTQDQLKQYNLSAQPLNDLAHEGDVKAGDSIWSFQFAIPDSAVGTLGDAPISGSQVILSHLSKDYAGNSVVKDPLAANETVASPIPAVITNITPPSTP